MQPLQNMPKFVSEKKRGTEVCADVWTDLYEMRKETCHEIFFIIR